VLGDEGQRDHAVVVSLLRITYDPAEPESVVVEVDACIGLRGGGGVRGPIASVGIPAMIEGSIPVKAA
jgi:hypothetical protein